MENVINQPRRYLGIEEVRNYKPLLQQMFAETLGTFLYLAIVLLVNQEQMYSVISVGLANGLLVASIVQIMGNVSGGHINPAVTVGAMVCGQIKVLRALCYYAAQLFGGCLGTAAAYAMLDDESKAHFGRIVQHSYGAIFCLEVLLTFLVVSVFISVQDLARGSRGLGSTSLAVGMSITCCEASCTFYSVGMNPIRMLSPAIVAVCVETAHPNALDASRLCIYGVAPLLGAALAGIVYKYLLNRDLGAKPVTGDNAA